MNQREDFSDPQNPYASPTAASAAAASGTERVYDYRPADTLVAVLTLLLLVNLIAFVVCAYSGWQQAQLLEPIAAGQPLPADAVLEANDQRQLMVTIGRGAVFLIAVVVFCMWVHRANCNARALGAAGMQHTPGWSVGWFFIPIANLFKPFQAVKEIWLASSPTAVDSPDDWRHTASSPVLGLWWAAWIICQFLLRLSDRLVNEFDVNSLVTATNVAVIGFIIGVPLSLLAIMVVRGIQSRQTQKYALLDRDVAMAPSLLPEQDPGLFSR